MEKAHRDVFNVLLQVLDDGRLSDNQGHTVNFTNTIVVMTSNVGSPVIQQISQEGGGEDEIREAVMEAVRAHFLPEFLNRIDETIIFHPLNRSEIRRIVDLQLELLHKKLDRQGIALQVTEAARNLIANLGFDPTYGARPLRRVIQQRIQNALATELLQGEISEGGGVKVDCQGDEFVFERLGPQPTVVETVSVT
jgi:ATP-dependent Clp protease ATP-binding subunit ClpB